MFSRLRRPISLRESLAAASAPRPSFSGRAIEESQASKANSIQALCFATTRTERACSAAKSLCHSYPASTPSRKSSARPPRPLANGGGTGLTLKVSSAPLSSSRPARTRLAQARSAWVWCVQCDGLAQEEAEEGGARHQQPPVLVALRQGPPPREHRQCARLFVCSAAFTHRSLGACVRCSS